LTPYNISDLILAGFVSTNHLEEKVNLNDILVLIFVSIVFTACGEKTEGYTLSTGTIVQVKPQGDHRYRIVNFDKLTHGEVIEFYFVISGGCVIRQKTEESPGMFGWLTKSQVIERDCAIPTLSHPVMKGEQV